jgi:RNA polymerase sigma-70 factor, ECF subfamily
MTPGRRRTASLRLVTSGPTDTRVEATDDRNAGRVAGVRDWSRLMARAQGGDRDAYRTLLEGITPYVRALAARRFKEAGDIEDAVQDVLLTVHAIRHAYDPRRPFGPWLVAVANRRIIDRLWRRMRWNAREVEFTSEHETFSSDPANLQAGFDDTSADPRALHAAIENLPPDQRQAVLLLKLREMSLKEASLMSGRSISALKVATHRAIKSLRKLLRPPSEMS